MPTITSQTTNNHNNNNNNNSTSYPEWANCISCGPIDGKKEDTELILLSCFHVVCAGPCYEGIIDNKDGKSWLKMYKAITHL